MFYEIWPSLDERPPTVLSVFNGAQVCGKRAGQPFSKTKRPISAGPSSEFQPWGTLYCDKGYKPCDPKGDLYRATCIKDT